MLIRQGEVKDLHSLVEMWGKLSDCHKDFIDYISPSFNYREIMCENFREDMSNPSIRILVAGECGENIGFIRGELRVNSNLISGGFFGYISDVFIEYEYRGLGVAETLLSEIVSWFRENGVNTVRLNVNSENIRAIGFYEKFGFKEVNKILALKINE
ncbi:GNAT family N-acetyltransferase [Anaerosalibacter sp. Marseille-P3206]|uniref:GNAT family N-acetyltransferase n=1 Tax=Anaerosalibacter sp. Marseille-P3206 TaxID=1871005 RepID=UPI000984CDA7|nr:GNAT family N-acetyltransferase [Anaerosalibacter sp. Marseille-P3206]